MTIKDTRKKAFDIYKSHVVNSWILSLICALFIAALCLVGIVSEILLIIIIPFLALPFFFSCIVSHLGLSAVDELSGKNLFRYFAVYFRPPFNSSFSVIVSFLKTLLVQLVIGGIVIGTCYAVFTASPTFIETFNKIVDMVRSGTVTSESLNAALDANGGELNRFIYLSSGISNCISAFAFIYFISKEAITIYTRLKVRDIPLGHQIAKATIRLNYSKYTLGYLALNWPLLVILIVGMSLGMVLSIFAFHNYMICGPVGISTGIALSSLYLPFYFANLEALNDYLAIDIASLSEEYVKGIFEKYGIHFKAEEVVEGTKKEEKEENPEEKKNDPSEDRNE